MKKIVLVIIMLFCIPFVLNADDYNYVSMGLEDSFKAENITYDLGDYKSNDGKVNIYLFRGQGCAHCKHFLQFVSDTLVKEYGDYFNLVSYETWHNDDNNHLMEEVKKELSVESPGVPFIVIGDKFFVGYGEARNEAIINLIKSEYENSERVDLVRNIISDDSSNGNASANYNENDKNSSNTLSEDSNHSSGIDMEIVVIIGIIIIALIVLVYVILTYRKLSKSK